MTAIEFIINYCSDGSTKASPEDEIHLQKIAEQAKLEYNQLLTFSPEQTVPETISFKVKDITELLTFVDMALQPDFPVNKSAWLLARIKQICLTYGINWTGRE